jgi:hypothetical protein
LSDVFITQLNAFHNQGTAFPPPAKLTVTQPLQATDAFAATGNVHILMWNNITSDVVNAINAGITGTPASLNASVAMVLQAQTIGQGIAINERDSAVTVAGAQTRGFLIISVSIIFWMSQVIPSNIQISNLWRKTRAPWHLSLARSPNFRFNTTTGVNAAHVAGNTLEDIAAVINGTAALSAQGISAVIDTKSGGRRLVIRDTDGNNCTPTDSGTLFSTLGMAPNSTSQTAFVWIRNDIARNPDLLARGTLNSTAAVGATRPVN